jgi:hypothetical protein
MVSRVRQIFDPTESDLMHVIMTSFNPRTSSCGKCREQLIDHPTFRRVSESMTASQTAFSTPSADCEIALAKMRLIGNSKMDISWQRAARTSVHTASGLYGKK